MVLKSEGVSCRSDLLERVGEGCGETSFCVLIVSNCEDCGAHGMCAFLGCLSDFSRFAWGLRVIANRGLWCRVWWTSWFEIGSICSGRRGKAHIVAVSQCSFGKKQWSCRF